MSMIPSLASVFRKLITCPLVQLAFTAVVAQAAPPLDLIGPVGSGRFGNATAILPNGNIVICDPLYDLPGGGAADAGAVYLYRPDGTLISRLTGGAAGDQVGSARLRVLTNGHFVVFSPQWNGKRGASTWGSATTGFIGGPDATVSAANSLVGVTPDDAVGGDQYIHLLTSGHYVVRTPTWDNGAVTDAGAVTWCNGFTGTVGQVSAANSLVGSTAADRLGFFVGHVVALPNGNYIVRSRYWDNGPAANAGAVTWGNGNGGTVGPITATNSLVGSTANDEVGALGDSITFLSTSHYVVCAPKWDNGAAVDAGAATWFNGNGGTVGVITPANSLVGTQTGDEIGIDGFKPLTNGHYVIKSPLWNNGSVQNAGAATWGNGNGGTVGAVTPGNSLVGTSTNDQIASGLSGVTALSNGHYVVCSSQWNNDGEQDAGAVTWGNGNGGTAGPVSAANSLIGTQQDDEVGDRGATPLPSGNYVISSPEWSNGAIARVGAATWCKGTGPTKGTLSAANSLIGSASGDKISIVGITVLANGNYLVRSSGWNNNAGAVTWGHGSRGIKGIVSVSNSLVGSSPNDSISSNGLWALPNGHYILGSQQWDNGAIVDAGAATWGNGFTGTTGPISAENSLVGTSPTDWVGNRVYALADGNYVVLSSYWDNGPTPNVGAVTWCNGNGGLQGEISLSNSLIGTSANDTIGYFIVDRIYPFPDGGYGVISPGWDNGPVPDAWAFTYAPPGKGITGFIDSTNSVLGEVTNTDLNNFALDYDPTTPQLIVGKPLENRVQGSSPSLLHSLAQASYQAPGGTDIAFAKFGSGALSPDGAALFDSALIGSSATKGRNRALFAADSNNAIPTLLLQSGTPIATLGSGLPANAVATAFTSQVFQQPGLGLVMSTAKGTGITSKNNRLLLLDSGVTVQLLRRTGQPLGVGTLAAAIPTAFGAPLQARDQNRITLNYQLAPNSVIPISKISDTGILLLNHSGTVLPNLAAREGQPAFSGGGRFGQFSQLTSAGSGSLIHFSALFQPDSGKPAPALFSMSTDGTSADRIAVAGQPAPGAGTATFRTFTALSEFASQPLIKATLKGAPNTENEGLWTLAPLTGTPLLRKGDEIAPATLPGVIVKRILRFWPVADENQIVIQVQLAGTGVKSSNNQALLLLQDSGDFQLLARTGQSLQGLESRAFLKTFSTIEVDPSSGHYAILATLKGAPPTSNQALWTGQTALGNDTDTKDLRLPKLALRKGDPYRSDAAPRSTTLIRSILLIPTMDKTGAGARGLGQIMNHEGHLLLGLLGDRKITETVVLVTD